MPDEIKGLGDVLAKVTSAFGITPCQPCKLRQAWLNQKIPFQSAKPIGTFHYLITPKTPK